MLCLLVNSSQRQKRAKKGEARPAPAYLYKYPSLTFEIFGEVTHKYLIYRLQVSVYQSFVPVRCYLHLCDSPQATTCPGVSLQIPAPYLQNLRWSRAYISNV